MERELKSKLYFFRFFNGGFYKKGIKVDKAGIANKYTPFNLYGSFYRLTCTRQKLVHFFII